MFVRELSPEEQTALDEALHSKSEFTRRRAQVLRFSAQRLRPRQIADGIGLSSQAVRNVIHDFHERGLDSLARRAMGPKAPERLFDDAKRKRLQEIAHRSPRHFGKARSTWSLPLLAEVAFEEGLTEHAVSHETIRQAIHALGSTWRRAKNWIRSPDPQYLLKKNSEIA
ncbi:MAG TPA: helix-turn-helix domain-containing protein [Acidobacteriota bacterium]|nr:helix-turn-helix domain-containing protein [Acidobacteriota bacterium]